MNEKIKNIFKNKKIMLILYSFISTLGITVLIDGFSKRNSSNNLFIILIFILFYFFIKNKKINYNRRNLICSIIFSIFLSFILIIGNQLEINHTSLSSLKLILGFISLAIMFVPFNLILFDYEISKTKEGKNYNKLYIKIFLILWLFGFTTWLALFPGGYDYDAPAQLAQFMNPNYHVMTNFSVLFSALEYVIVSLGYKVFGSYQIAIGIFTLIQMTIVSLITSYTVCFIYKKSNYNFKLLVLSTLFYAIFPFHLLLQISCVQDTLFSCSILIFTISIYKMLKTEKCSVSDIISLILSGIFTTLFRNNGIYIIIFVLIISVLLVALLKIKINKKLYFISLLIIIMFYYIYSLLFLPAIGVLKGNTIREMSSIPSQQLARVYNYNRNVFTKSELNKLNKFYPNCDFSAYMIRQSISDPIKICIDQKYTKNHFKEYIDLYTSIGVKDFKNYTVAFFLNTYGFWYPNKSYPDNRIFHPYIEYKISTPSMFSKDLIEIKRSSKIPILKKYFDMILDYNNWQKIPVISTICSMGTYFVLVMFVLLLSIYKRKYEFLILLSVYVGIYATLFLAPVALYRYVYSIAISIPFLLLIIYEIFKKQNKTILPFITKKNTNKKKHKNV